MKHTAAFILAVALCFRCAAQWPAGAPAPDFAAPDLTGQPWHLYDVLDQGKIVVLAFASTGCQPCWAYHQSKALENFYAAHGPAGDDRARVFFLEADPATPPECLNGPGDCPSFTPGNWLAGNSYPFFDNSTVAQSYAVDFLPAVYVVCPNRKAYAVGTLPPADLWAAAQTCPVAYGTNNAGLFSFSTGTSFTEVCDSLWVAPSLRLINLGAAALTQAAVQLRWNGEPVQTVQWSGNLGLYGETPVQFAPYPLTGAGTLQTVLLTVNGNPADDEAANNAVAVSFTAAGQTPVTHVVLRLRTDEYGAETYWEIRDTAGAVVEHGGNQAVGPAGGAQFPAGIGTGPGAYGDLVIIRDTIALPAEGCYSLHLVDAYGDGLCCAYGAGFYRLYGLDDPVTPIVSGGTFKAYDRRVFRAGLPPVSTAGPATPGPAFDVFPNPAFDRLIIDFAEKIPDQLVIYNALGQPVYVQTAPAARLEIAVQHWPPGVYQVVVMEGGRAWGKRVVLGR